MDGYRSTEVRINAHYFEDIDELTLEFGITRTHVARECTRRILSDTIHYDRPLDASHNLDSTDRLRFSLPAEALGQIRQLNHHQSAYIRAVDEYLRE